MEQKRMKAKRIISITLVLAMLFSCMNIDAFADKEANSIYVNLGDSIAYGSVENNSDNPNYNHETCSYSGLFASYLGVTKVDYAELGMQTTDILYMLDENFRNDVDFGIITPDSWHKDYYPPFNGTSINTVMENIKNADYISLCVGGGDVVAFPGELMSRALDEIINEDEAETYLDKLFDEGQLDENTFKAFKALIKNSHETALALINLLKNVLEGYEDYSIYYPRIVENLRAANSDATIILVGLFIPTGKLPFLKESPEISHILFHLNRLLDNINIVIKETAKANNCYYVDTMGIDSNWHPTITGHQQIFNRMISVLDGDSTYAGDSSIVTKVASIVQKKLNKLFQLDEEKRMIY